MPPERSTLASYAVTAAPLLGLELDPELLPGVVDNLTRLFAQAALVLEFPLDDHVESAAVFLP